MILALLACGKEEDESAPSIPDPGTPWIIYGTAPSGRAVMPGSVQVRSDEALASVAPAAISGGNVDMFLAGIDPADIPRGSDPPSLRLTTERAENAHRLYRLVAPSVLTKPVPSGDPFQLVPVEGQGVAASISLERKRRLDVLTQGLSVEDPCSLPTAPIDVLVPLSPGEKLLTTRTLSSGTTFAGLTTTGTVVLMAIDAAARRVELFPVNTGAAIDRRERVTVTDLGNREARDRSGRTIPRDLTLTYEGSFRGIAQLLSWDDAAGAYVDQTPTGGAPASFAGARGLELDGEPALCAYGAELGPNRVASIYCRVGTSTVWSPPDLFQQAFSIVGLVGRPGGPALAFDQTGTIYARRNHRWEGVTRAAINDGCTPACVLFRTFSEPEGGAGAPAVGLLGGAKAQVLIGEADGAGGTTLRSIDALPAALFADERADGDHALQISSMTISPDGAIWMGSTEHVLLRVSPDRSAVERLCLPPEAAGAMVTDLRALPDGTLLLGMSPAILGFARWRP